MNLNKLPTGANYELFSKRSKKTRVSYAGSKFERIESKDSLNNRLRLLSDGKIVTVNSTDPKGVDKLLEDAVAISKYGSAYNESFAKAAAIKPLTLFDQKSLSAKEMIEIMSDLVAGLTKLDSRLVVEGNLSHDVEEITLKTSEGFDAGYKTSLWELFAYATLVQGDDRYDIANLHLSICPDFNLNTFIEEVGQRLEWGTNVVDFKAGTYPVIFAPEQVGHLVVPISESLNGQAFFDKTSPWLDKLGTKVLDSRISIVDDGTIDNTYTSRPFDDEGTPTQRNVMVEGGVIKNILLDNKYAARLNKSSTGNASAYGEPAFNFLDMAKGEKTLDDMIKSIDYGVLVYNSMGAWSGNPFVGIVSGTISEGFKIENGKVAGRIKDTMFTVNTFEHLDKHLVDLSKKGQNVFAGFSDSMANLPYMQLDKVVISAE